MKRKLFIVCALVFAVLFFLAGMNIVGWYRESHDTRMEFVRISALVDREAALNTYAGISGSADESEGAVPESPSEESTPEILPEYLTIYELNPDFAGWISIEGTEVDYPVMQTPEEPDFYIDHGFEKETSGYGVPYIQYNCDLLSSDNLIVYGHYMRNGSMFADIHMYMYKDFYERHKVIRFDTRYTRGSYEVVAAFKTTGNDYGFPYHHFVNAADEQEFNEYIEKCKELSLYEIETTARYGDKLITLSTCDYSRRDGRMVVVAKLISDAQ